MLRASLILTAALGAWLAVATAQAQNEAVPSDRGFVPDTGQINPGGAPKVPSAKPSQPIPAREEIRAALMMPDPGTISTGEQPNAGGTPQPATTGKGITDVEEPGPIGSTMQTKPAKFSHRNDVIDHTPIMGMPIRLDEQQRQQIFQAIMDDKTQPASAKQDLNPADALPFSLIDDMHPLPESLRAMPSLAKLDYVKTKDKVYLVTEQTTIIVDLLDGK